MPYDSNGDRIDPRAHVHEAAHESATSPDFHGVMTVTERCDCGRVLRTYLDSIL